MAKWLKLYTMYRPTFSTKPDPRHYTALLNANVLNFYLYAGFITIRSCLETIFCVSTRRRPGLSSTRHRCFPKETETQKTRRRQALVSVYAAHFEHKF